ncbi:hypothetical protein GGR50DRAFT_694499 [Xylaria sp. CBS 124048]|nr:hypothetical protein GGR50DRAFT_694499 [Xylaria sp. CBS 124048]
MPGLIQDQIAGCIKWLPPKDELKASELDVDEGCYLEQKFPAAHRARSEHLPISPSNAHPDNQILLFLENPSVELKKKSYVKTRDRHSVFLSSLRPYKRHGPDIFLSKRSYKTLVEYVQFVEAPDVSGGSSSRRQEELGMGVGVGVDIDNVLSYARMLAAQQQQKSDRPAYYGDSTTTTTRVYPQATLNPPVAASARTQYQPLLPTYEDTSRIHHGYTSITSTARPAAPRYNNAIWASHGNSHHYGAPSASGADGDGHVGGEGVRVNWRAIIKVILWTVFSAAVLYGGYRGSVWVINVIKGAISAMGKKVEDWASGVAGKVSSLGGAFKSKRADAGDGRDRLREVYAVAGGVAGKARKIAQDIYKEF